LRKNKWEELYPKHSEEWSKKMEEFIEKIKTDDVFAKEYGEL
jgi:hypothetical protein